MNLLLSLLFFIGSTPSLAPVLRAGDEEFKQINYPAALSLYETALRSAPDDPDVLWRLSRVYLCMGEVTDDEQRERYFGEGEKYARACIRADEKRAEGHTGLAAALGSIAIHSGIGTQVRLSREIKQELDRAIELDPNDHVAYSILGSFYRALGNATWLERGFANIFLGDVPVGGFEEAEAALRKAIALAPEVMRNHYELGVLYIDMGREDEARTVLAHAAALPVRIASDRDRLLRIAEFLPRLRQSNEESSIMVDE